jgi:hypothetical protein
MSAKNRFERLGTKFIYKFGQFPCSWIRVRIPNTDLDPGDFFIDFVLRPHRFYFGRCRFRMYKALVSVFTKVKTNTIKLSVTRLHYSDIPIIEQ